jgi:hypothetical protein
MAIINEDRASAAQERAVRQRLTSPRSAGRPAQPRVETVECPRCGRFTARIIGRSETVPVVYLRCDSCHQTSVAGA